MRTSRTDGDTEARLNRLAGDGKRGGGLPLPLLFAAILEELLDEGQITTERATAITSAKLEFKERQVMATWRSWDELAADVLLQMKQRGIIRSDGGNWLAGPRFTAGKPMAVIPERPGKSGKSLGVTIHERSERDRRAQLAEIQMTITELASKILPDGAGIRPVDRSQVEKIRDSLPDAGHLYPVLVDKQGHILDGKHRLAADPDWPRKEIKAARDDLSALAVARLANMGQPLPAKVASAIDRLLGDTRAAHQALQQKVAAALIENPRLNHNAIAKRVGVDNHTVADACDSLIRSVLISECEHNLEESGRQARGPKPKGSRRGPHQDRRRVTPEIEEQITERVADGASVKEIAAEFDIGEMPARDAQQRAWGRLEERAQANGLAQAPEATAAATPPAGTMPSPAADHMTALRAIVAYVQQLSVDWADEQPDTASELLRWLELRDIIDERVAMLR